MTQELKPCPFCGGSETYTRENNGGLNLAALHYVLLQSRNRIVYLGEICGSRYADSNNKDYVPPLEELIASVGQARQAAPQAPNDDLLDKCVNALREVKSYIQQDGQHVRDLYPVFGLAGFEIREIVNKALAAYETLTTKEGE